MFVLLYAFILKCIFAFGLGLFSLFVSWYYYNEFIFSWVGDEHLPQEFDYIVVGAGTAGSIVALRLAEDGASSVLLLEAGCYGGAVLNVPMSASLLRLSLLDWQYKTIPQEHACGAFHNNQCLWPRGKLIGGSSRLNNMIHTHGHPFDYATWFLHPNTTSPYNYNNDIEPYFDIVASYLLDNNHIPYVTELAGAFLDAGRKVLGVPIRDILHMGVDNDHTTGFMIHRSNIKNGARYESGEYLLENKPENLVISTHSFGERVILDGDNKIARAVRFSRFGTLREVRCRKGIILSAGTISSPHLLLLSGIGPSSHLTSHSLPTHTHLPAVGANLQDHISTGFDLFHLPQPLNAMSPFQVISPFTFLRYVIGGEGPWTSGQCDGIGVFYMDCVEKLSKGGREVNMNETYDECERRQTGPPDMQFMLIPMSFSADQGLFLRRVVGLTDQMWAEYISDPDRDSSSSNTFFILPVLLHPKSRGSITLTSPNPHSPPLINPNYLSHPADVTQLVRGLKLAVRLVMDSESPFQQTGKKSPLSQLDGGRVWMNERKVPGCGEYRFGSDEYWECYVRKVTLTVYHPVGTCRMGISAMDSVVDHNFRVHGVSNLFVVDASVMPNLISGNINAAVAMLAEKASQLIKSTPFIPQRTQQANIPKLDQENRRVDL